MVAAHRNRIGVMHIVKDLEMVCMLYITGNEVMEYEFVWGSPSLHPSVSPSGALQNQTSQSCASSSRWPVSTATYQHPSLRLRLLSCSRLWRPRDLGPFPAPTREESAGAFPFSGVPCSAELSTNISQHPFPLTQLIHQGALPQTVYCMGCGRRASCRGRVTKRKKRTWTLRRTHGLQAKSDIRCPGADVTSVSGVCL